MRVPGHGPKDARIVILGEAPGSDEELEGRPFVGASGRELNRMLGDGGILRSDCYATNVFKHRPPDNDISKFWLYTGRQAPKKLPPGFVQAPNQAFVRKDMESELLETDRELRELKPNVIIALGNAAMWFTCGIGKGITNWSGSIMDSPYGKTIPSIHPAAILRNWSWRAASVRDFQRCNEQSFYPEVRHPPWEFILNPSIDKILKTLEDLPEVITCDIETRKGHIVCVGIGWSKTHAMCIPIMHTWTLDEELAIVQALRKALLSRKVVNQNYLYDSFYFGWYWGFLSIPHFDTLIASHTCFPDLPKSLDFICRLHCDFFRFWKEDGREWLPGTPSERLWYYNCQDCVYTYEAAESLAQTIISMNLQEQFNFQMSLFKPTLKMMLRGCSVSPTKRKSTVSLIDQRVTDLENEINTLLGQNLNVKSSKQLRDLFYTDFKMQIITNRKTGNPTTDEEALKKIAAKEPLLKPVVDRITKVVHYKTLKSNWLEASGPEDRLFCSFNMAGAKTFRYSSSKNPLGYGVNLQNVPKEKKPNEPDVRDIFVPELGMILLEGDLKSADLHVVAWEVDDPEMKQMLREGVDFYQEGSKELGMNRDQGKIFIHGTNYGGRPRTMAVNCGITVHMAEQLNKRYFSRFPRIKAWHKRIENQLLSTGTVSNAFGFLIHFFDRPDGLLPEALAWIPQSTVGLLINHGLRAVPQILEPHGYIELQVHDSLLMQIKEPLWRTFVPHIQKAMTHVVPYPDPLTIPVEFAWSSVSWSKQQMQKIDLKDFCQDQPKALPLITPTC